MVAIIHYLHFEQSSNVKLNLWNLPLIFHVVITVASKCKIKKKKYNSLQASKCYK